MIKLYSIVCEKVGLQYKIDFIQLMYSRIPKGNRSQEIGELRSGDNIAVGNYSREMIE